MKLVGDMMKILCVGAHPDDIEYAMGGTLQKHIMLGDEIKCLVLTDGERNEEGYHVYSEMRREESTRALNFLGVKDIKFFNFSEIINMPELRVPLEKEIQEFKPDRIYSHSVHDRHQEHRNTFEIIQSIGRNVPEIFLFEIYSSTPEFQPNYFIEFPEDYLDKKVKALQFHHSQFGATKTPIDKITFVNSVFRANSTLGGRKETLLFAEAFEVLKIFKRNRDV